MICNNKSCLFQVELAYPISFSAWFIPKAMNLIGQGRGCICNEPRLGILLQLHSTKPNQDPWTPQGQPLQCLDDVKITSVNGQSGHLRKPRVGNPKPTSPLELLPLGLSLRCHSSFAKEELCQTAVSSCCNGFPARPRCRSQEHMVPYVPSRHPQRSQRNEVLAWLPAGLPREYVFERWKMKVPRPHDERWKISDDPGHASGKQGPSLWRPDGCQQGPIGFLCQLCASPWVWLVALLLESFAHFIGITLFPCSLDFLELSATESQKAAGWWHENWYSLQILLVCGIMTMLSIGQLNRVWDNTTGLAVKQSQKEKWAQ